jgi:formate hydrogenlyase subunit 4
MLNLVVCLGAMVVLALLIGVIESVMARLRLVRVPQLLVTAGILSFLAVMVAMR